MEKIVIFNTWIGSRNLGDQIIMESSKNELLKIFDEYFFFEMPTQLEMLTKEFKVLKEKETKAAFVCGTNLLGPLKLKARRNQWKIGLKFLMYVLTKKIDTIVLVGAGWNKYQDKKITFLEKLFLRKLLINNHIHSVRDEYTKKKLKEIGIENVINTGCVTTWGLTKEKCKNRKVNKAKKAIITLTDYNRDFELDRELFEIVNNNYEEIYFWPQGTGDLEYVKELIKNEIKYKIINPNYESYKKFLKENECDFIGTRLHGGIKALQLGKRTIIIGIDNRALEMKENKLPILDRKEIRSKLDDMINSEFKIEIEIFDEEIKKWKEQFKITK